MRIVKIKTPDFSGEALEINELPWQHVLPATIMQTKPEAVGAYIALCRESLLNDAGRNAFDTLSFAQVLDVIRAWTSTQPYKQDIFGEKEFGSSE